MHIQIDYTEFKQKLELAARISTKHLTLPALQCVLLKAKNKTLTIHATNLEVGVICDVPITTNKADGTVAVSASTLLQIVTLSTQKEISLKTEGNVLIVSSRNSHTKINTIDTSEFPTIPKSTIGGKTLNGKIFALGIKHTAFSVSQSSIKPELGSVYIHQKKEHTLTFVGTDSFRLMEKTTPQQGIALSGPLLIPQKNALEIAHICEVLEENPELHIDDNQCALNFKEVYVTSRLTNGTFPDYEQIIPKEYTTHTTLLTKDLMLALKKTNIFLNKFMQLAFTTKKDALTLSAQSGEVGEITETIPTTTDGDELTLSFNQRYIHEVLSYITDESITLNFAGIGRPLVIKGVHDTSMRYLVMPMNK